MWINHLFFANGSLIFCKANSLEWSRLVHLLDMYEKSSRQALNKEKTSIFFSFNTPKDVQHNIIQIIGIKAIGTFEKYLGLQAFLGKNKSKSFQVLLDKT